MESWKELLLEKAIPAMRQRPALCAVTAGGALLMLIRLLRSKTDRRSKMVLVTGSAQGLGRAIALALIKRGDFVVGSDVDEDGLKELEKQFPTKFLSLPMNVGSATSVAEAAARLLKFSGKPCLDAIVNNAGIMRGGPMVEMDDPDMAAILNVNVLGPFLVTKHFFPLIKRDGDVSYHPRIINFGSEVSYARLSAIFNGPYAMTKFAQEAYSESLRQELSILKHPVYVTIVNPGPHESGMTKKGHNALGRRDHQGSLFTNQLSKGSGPVQFYMDFFGKPASNVGEAVASIVHLYNPPLRVKLNVSILMEISRLVPQELIDFTIRMIM